MIKGMLETPLTECLHSRQKIARKGNHGGEHGRTLNSPAVHTSSAHMSLGCHLPVRPLSTVTWFMRSRCDSRRRQVKSLSACTRVSGTHIIIHCLPFSFHTGKLMP